MHHAPRTLSIAATSLSLLLALAARMAFAWAPPAPAPFLRLTGAAPGDRFGVAVSAVGDVNGDGFSDIVVGAEWSDADAPNAGRATVYFGGPLVDEVPDLTLQAPIVQSRSLTGYAVAIVGDVNGDGWTDIAVGSPVSQFMGRVFLYWGGPSLDATSDRTLGGLRSLEFFGAALAGVGDANGDGFDDVWVGAPRFVAVNSTASRVGRGYLFYGGPAADGVVDVLFEARPIGGIIDELQFGTSVAPAGDVNRDGFDDILVGQPADGTITTGRAYIYHGGIPVHRAPDRAFLPPAYRFRAGASVSRAGDFNADGADDFLVGAPDSGEDGEITAGRAYLYYGGQEPLDAAMVDVEFAGPGGYDAFGAAVAGGADVSGDGYPDILVGAPQAEGVNGIRAGRVYVYYGGPGADAVADVVLEGPAPDGTLGTSISLGDVNGDGVADAIVGAAGLQGSRTDPGHIFVFDLVAPLPARAFAHDEHRTIPLQEQGAPVCIRVEALDSAFEIRDLDPASIRLRSLDGKGEAIHPAAAKRIVESDSDRNGVAEIGVCFARAELRRLFAAVRGRQRVVAALEGRLLTGRLVAGEVALTVVGTGPSPGQAASVAPNPMNPEATLSFTLRTPGSVDVRLFDANGRLVRTIAPGLMLSEGRHQLRIDGRDDRGGALRSGVYFYRIRTPDGETRGRLVVAK